jgi:hypothetical protein
MSTVKQLYLKSVFMFFAKSDEIISYGKVVSVLYLLGEGGID